MKKKKTLIRIITAIFACIFLLSMLSFTAYATGDGGEDDAPVSDDGPGDDGGSGDDGSGDGGSGDGGDPGEFATDAPDQGDIVSDEPTEGEVSYEEPTEEPIDAQSTYTEPEHLDELPEVSDGEVVPATAAVLPPATVSDASLLSGVIMWLCVAVGIAVVVGVLVSRRTRRRGP